MTEPVDDGMLHTESGIALPKPAGTPIGILIIEGWANPVMFIAPGDDDIRTVADEITRIQRDGTADSYKGMELNNPTDGGLVFLTPYAVAQTLTVGRAYAHIVTPEATSGHRGRIVRPGFN